MTFKVGTHNVVVTQVRIRFHSRPDDEEVGTPTLKTMNIRALVDGRRRKFTIVSTRVGVEFEQLLHELRETGDRVPDTQFLEDELPF